MTPAIADIDRLFDVARLDRHDAGVRGALADPQPAGRSPPARGAA